MTATQNRQGHSLRKSLDDEGIALKFDRTLSPTEEKAAAERIVARRQAYWAKLLGYRPLQSAMFGAIERTFPKPSRPTAEIAAVRRAAQARSGSRARATQRKLDEAVDSLAVALGDLDQSCDLADSLFADLQAMAGGRRPMRLDARRPRAESQPFRQLVGEVERARWSLDQARHRFVRANIGLVVTMARRYTRNGRMPLADLIQEGNVGLMTAVDRFDPRRGFRFSTYGSWWIRHAIGRALSDKGRAVRLPVHVIELQQKMNRASREFEQVNHRKPSRTELARIIDVPEEKLARLDRALLEQDFPRMGGPQRRTERTMDDLFADAAPSPESQIYDGELGQALEAALAGLPAKEAEILRLRFGLDGGKSKTLREIGTMYSLSRERIRQIQEGALSRLRGALGRAGVGSGTRQVESWA